MSIKNNMKNTILFLAFILTVFVSNSQTITFMNAGSASVTATYSVSVSGKQGNILISVNSTFNGTTTKDSLFVGSKSSIDGTIRWAPVKDSNGNYVVYTEAANGTYLVQLLPSPGLFYKIDHTAGDATLGTETATITLF
jgi:hypothetical protein